jgi:hypothetical protein
VLCDQLPNSSDGVQQTGRRFMVNQAYHLNGGILTQCASDLPQVRRTRPWKGQLHDIKTMNRRYLGHTRPIDAIVDDQHFALGMQCRCDGRLQRGSAGSRQQDSGIVAVRGESLTQQFADTAL